MPVDVKSAEFRTVRFASLDDMLAEADRLAAAERAGTLRATGNWTLGQTLGHIAGWMDYAFDGYPPDVRPPWFIKLLLKGKKQKFISGTMPRGVKIPGLPGGTLNTQAIPTEDGLNRLRAAAARLKAACPPHPNPIFGPLTQAEWTALNLRHADLHLGYLRPG